MPVALARPPPPYELIYLCIYVLRILLMRCPVTSFSPQFHPPLQFPLLCRSLPLFPPPALAWLKSMLAGMYVSYGYIPTQPNPTQPHPPAYVQYPKKKGTLYFVCTNTCRGLDAWEGWLGWVGGEPTNLFHHPSSVRFIIIIHVSFAKK